MTDRNLLRAQLLIEAADLLDEGYNKPNTNDKIRTAEMSKKLDKYIEENKQYLKRSLLNHDKLGAAEAKDNIRYAEQIKNDKEFEMSKNSSRGLLPDLNLRHNGKPTDFLSHKIKGIETNDELRKRLYSK